MWIGIQDCSVLALRWPADRYYGTRTGHAAVPATTTTTTNVSRNNRASCRTNANHSFLFRELCAGEGLHRLCREVTTRNGWYTLLSPRFVVHLRQCKLFYFRVTKKKNSGGEKNQLTNDLSCITTAAAAAAAATMTMVHHGRRWFENTHTHADGYGRILYGQTHGGRRLGHVWAHSAIVRSATELLLGVHQLSGVRRRRRDNALSPPARPLACPRVPYRPPRARTVALPVVVAL